MSNTVQIPEDIKKKLNDSMFMKGGNTESEKSYYAQGFNDGYSLQLEEKDKEIERLKGLIRKAHDTGLVAGFADHAKGGLLKSEYHWQQFKETNKL